MLKLKLSVINALLIFGYTLFYGVLVTVQVLSNIK